MTAGAGQPAGPLERQGGVTDDETFAQFMAGALPGLLRFGHVLTGDPVRAEELAQSALVQLYLRWGRRDLEQPYAYVRRSMVNAYTSWWRRSRRDAALPAGLDVPHSPPDYGERDAVLRALRLLPPKQRAVIVLRYYEDLPEAAIAEALGCSPGTVKSHASRALRTLRSSLAPTDLESTLR